MARLGSAGGPACGQAACLAVGLARPACGRAACRPAVARPGMVRPGLEGQGAVRVVCPDPQIPLPQPPPFASGRCWRRRSLHAGGLMPSAAIVISGRRRPVGLPPSPARRKARAQCRRGSRWCHGRQRARRRRAPCLHRSLMLVRVPAASGGAKSRWR